MIAARIVLPLAVALALTGCTGTGPTDPNAARDCPDGIPACGQFGPPVTRYCVADRGACDGHAIRPEDVSGRLFAGVTVTGTGRAS